jgi:hypothetical protein
MRCGKYLNALFRANSHAPAMLPGATLLQAAVIGVVIGAVLAFLFTEVREARQRSREQAIPRRGWGTLYAVLSKGRIDTQAVRALLDEVDDNFDDNPGERQRTTDSRKPPK